ncbi:DNA/RNA non-specific endonuclease [Cellulosilyticum sp. I15G10I2]|uniref:DNA/RNA non-specific endonuclease n=1 Tax=Cellulosilyticum sp. I15G10I2 TaxID=1892843 RepID=UPI000B24A19D|nr:DNA/RNA non-specific endonuclease [Cellulosilyticum sp. I15G10I2]
MKKIKYILLQLMLVFCLLFTGCSQISSEVMPSEVTEQSQSKETSAPEIETNKDQPIEQQSQEASSSDLSLNDIPNFSNNPYVIINNNEPEFSESDFTTTSFEQYSNLDSLGRCGVAFANICIDLMPTEKRGSIGQVKPSGWHTIKYDNIDGKYLYNRCHLIGFQLTAENANEKNLITGTRYLNVDGMLPFENMVADYIKETENLVLYRVTPIYEGNNLVAKGVQMEAMSVEDKGEGICFNVFVYNNQPGVMIDYATGESRLLDQGTTEAVVDNNQKHAEESTYILNSNTLKFHKPSCSSVTKMSDANKKTFTGSRDDLIAEDYSPCKICNP